MKRLTLILSFFLCAGMASGYSLWDDVRHRYDVGDYDGMYRMLSAASLRNGEDTVKCYYWLGEYYYWLSYENREYAVTARRMYECAILYKKICKVPHVPLGYCYLHLGEVCYLQASYDEGIGYLTKALSNSPFDMRNHTKDPVYKGLGMCYAMMGDYTRALRYLDRCDGNTRDAYSAMRMKGKVHVMAGDTMAAVLCYGNFLGQIREVVKDSFQHLSAGDRESWWMSVRPFIADCWRLEKASPEMLYDVALLTKGILLQQNTALEITHDDILRALPQGSAAIEWMVYENGGKRHLGTVVMRSDGAMRFVYTAEVDSMKKWAEKGSGIFSNSRCCSAIWSAEMLNAIGGAKRLYFSPDGVLNQIGLEYMYPDEEAKLYRVTSTREILRQRKADYASAAIFGDMLYSMTDSDTIYDNIENDEYAYLHMKSHRLMAPQLRYSQSECLSINAVRNSASDTLVMSTMATERNFRSMAGLYDMLFISTHGYCLTSEKYENSDFPRREVVDHSLSESGLLFSGFNTEQRLRRCRTDGIVSARELCKMDLSKVNLCVVSACEGALGRVSADGIYGIQRGLKSAGAGAMILSLWEVDDEATSIFMTYLINGLAQGKNLHDAFAEARSSLRTYSYVFYDIDEETMTQRPVVVRCFDSPEYYNSFIIIDEIMTAQ